MCGSFETKLKYSKSKGECIKKECNGCHETNYMIVMESDDIILVTLFEYLKLKKNAKLY